MQRKTVARIWTPALLTLVLVAVLSVHLLGLPSPKAAIALEVTRELQWESLKPDESLAHAFMQAVRPQIQAAITGAYGGTPLYENEKVIEVRRLKNDPKVVAVEIRANTFSGAHNPLGTVTIVFRSTPSQLYVGEVKTEKEK